MAELIKGVSPDAELVVNEHGGKQSKTAYAFHLIDTDAILALAEVLQYGVSRYERDNWRRIPSEEHYNHMLIHYYAWLKGDTSDDHLGHFFCRAMMLYATGKAEEAKDKPVEPWGDDDEQRLGGLCGAEYDEDYDCSKCPFDKPRSSDTHLCDSKWLEAHPAEARKIMDEMERGKVAGQ